MNEHRFRWYPEAQDEIEFSEELSQLVQLADENGVPQYAIERILNAHLNDLDNLCDDGS